MCLTFHLTSQHHLFQSQTLSAYFPVFHRRNLDSYPIILCVCVCVCVTLAGLIEEETLLRPPILLCIWLLTFLIQTRHSYSSICIEMFEEIIFWGKARILHNPDTSFMLFNPFFFKLLSDNFLRLKSYNFKIKRNPRDH